MASLFVRKAVFSCSNLNNDIGLTRMTWYQCLVAHVHTLRQKSFYRFVNGKHCNLLITGSIMHSLYGLGKQNS